jgi:endonuclease/exonuclease/phosphatase family metal-dependent hydrolase
LLCRGEIKLQQLQRLLAAMHETVHTLQEATGAMTVSEDDSGGGGGGGGGGGISNSSVRPSVVICGDFNSTPDR